MSKVELIKKLAEIVESSSIENDRLNELLGIKKEEEPTTTAGKVILTILAIIGGVAAVCAIAYAVYQYMRPDYLEEFEEDFDDDFDDDFFEDEEDEPVKEEDIAPAE